MSRQAQFPFPLHSDFPYNMPMRQRAARLRPLKHDITPLHHRRRKAWVRRVGPDFIARTLAGGFAQVEACEPINLERLPEGRKWVSGAGAVPLMRNTLLGVAVLRKLDAKNQVHRTAIGCKLYLVWKGSAVVRVEGRDRRLSRGDLLFVPPLYAQQVRRITPGSVLLVFRAPDAGDTKLDKLDADARPFARMAARGSSRER